MTSVRLFSFFKSIQGESTRAGLPCTFVRLAGCSLLCRYCDTSHVRDAAGTMTEVGDIVRFCEEAEIRLVEVTGGEPLEQPGTRSLLSALSEAGFEVLLETSGAYPVCDIDPRVRIILDIKTPGSGMEERFCRRNLDFLFRDRHEVKFVISSRADFDWAVSVVKREAILNRCEVLVSPVAGDVSFDSLAAWILESGLSLRFQPQLHKLIWPNAAPTEER
jgi:7-carboxy-7-deazaguanine synthase